MIHYKVFSENPASHYIDVEMTIDEVSTPVLELQLPAWRPGRYELGNFAKNVKQVEVFGDDHSKLNYQKSTKDLWVVETNGAKKITVTYAYFTSEINAGSCYVDEQQLYLNPVHVCLYVPNRTLETHAIALDVPDSYRIATALPIHKNTCTAQSYDQLADSPIMASASIQSDYYELSGIKFWLHFNGECRPDFAKIKSDFIKFTQTQLSFWGSFPVAEYHFLFQILPFKFYHGVEHQTSTVIAIGPGYSLNQGKVYEDILGVSSHELFHTWNIKFIRPKEMLPYDFSKENYARTGYVYEGFTTYYGDLMLLTSGVFSNQEYYETLEERLIKHFHNYGRFNLSVAHSSWDTWLDGYVPGAPYRKTSIYDEGNLIAFMLDITILKHSNHQKGLRDVCRALYEEFGKQNRGYAETDIIELCERFAGIPLTDFFKNYVYGTENFELPLQDCFDYLGLQLVKIRSMHPSESVYGFKTVDFGYHRKISMIAPGSPAWLAGLSIGDEIVGVNGYSLKNDFQEWMFYFKDQELELTIASNQHLKTVKLIKNKTEHSYFDHLKIKDNTLNNQNFLRWIHSNS